MLLAPGTQLGPYRIVGVLGGGGMGEVYQATDTRLGRTVAVKVLQGRLAESAAHRERFEREARLISQLNHPHICTLHDVGTDNGAHYLVMEHVDGVTLESRLRQGPLSNDETIIYATQIADALNAAHRRGIVHRDLKPANIMLTRSGVKILDFGLAKLSADPAAANDEGRAGSELTEQGTILGTTQYMAPEQLEGKAADARTDIFAFGAIVYEMLTGKRPFEGGSKASLIASILKDTPRRISASAPSVAPGLESTILRCLAKEPDDRWQSAGDLLFQLRADSAASHGAAAVSAPPRAAVAPRARPRWLVPAVALTAVAAAAIAFVLVPPGGSSAGATPENLARLEALVDNADWEAAHALALQIEAVSPDNTELGELRRRSSNLFTLTSEPPGAHVFRRAYEGTESDWVELGTTPIRDVRLPIGLSSIRLEREGYEPLQRNLLGGISSATRETQSAVEQGFVLMREGTVPAGTVQVPGWREVIQGAPIDFADFFIGQYEVTNREYKEFIDSRGYERPEFWQHPIVQDGRELPWQEAMKRFTDQTGLPGPSTWIAGDYPDGQDEYPVGGVSWYEAAAFARFAGRELPTVHHWRRAALNLDPVLPGIDLAWVLRKSNLEGDGPAPVSQFDAPGSFGTYDTAGNVREWTHNAVGPDRFILGGGWSDNRYMGMDPGYRAPPLDRSPINGFRLAVVRDEAGKLAAASAEVAPVAVPDWSRIAPVSDDTFEAYKSHYAYEPAPLNAISEATETFRSWSRERITFDAAYDGARMVLYLYLPLNASPPYQTVVFFPAAGAWLTTDSVDRAGMPLDWLIKSGRAVAVPILRGTYERRDGLFWMGVLPGGGPSTVPGREAFVKVVQDARRSIDYLVTRPDVAPDAIVYYGLSIGSSFAPQILAQEPRFRLAVLSLAGLFPQSPTWLPELRPTAFLPRVTQPALVFSGDLDMTFPLETAAKPFFAMLGTPAADKEQVIVPGGHTVLTATQARRTLEFLDQRLGRVPTPVAQSR
jgi:formylglycine-generating enzyme required for sulfatase activity/dienelactone hydrolase